MDPAALLDIDDVVFLSGKASSMRNLRVRMAELSTARKAKVRKVSWSQRFIRKWNRMVRKIKNVIRTCREKRRRRKEERRRRRMQKARKKTEIELSGSTGETQV